METGTECMHSRSQDPVWLLKLHEVENKHSLERMNAVIDERFTTGSIQPVPDANDEISKTYGFITRTRRFQEFYLLLRPIFVFFVSFVSGR